NHRMRHQQVLALIGIELVEEEGKEHYCRKCRPHAADEDPRMPPELPEYKRTDKHEERGSNAYHAVDF
ncbi:MAG: hypothetical protein IIT86_05060, partial [Oscillospiraceae bacterium]|nr:hypothetical protein [Oscillospiraceae bacterium]